jgi:hypothetical protein
MGGTRHAEQKYHDQDGRRQAGRCCEALHCCYLLVQAAKIGEDC